MAESDMAEDTRQNQNARAAAALPGALELEAIEQRLEPVHETKSRRGKRSEEPDRGATELDP